MAANAQINPALHGDATEPILAIVARERLKSMMLRAWILAGIFFMALPGTLLGFSNLMAISAHHGAGSLPAAWLEGHGHAQVFGWIGCLFSESASIRSLHAAGQSFGFH